MASLAILIVELLLLWLFTPCLGPEDAALAVGLAWLGQGLLHIAQMRWITGTYAYTARVGRTLAWALGCLFILRIIEFCLAWTGAPNSSRVIAFVCFLGLFAGGVYQLWRTRPAMQADPGSGERDGAASGGMS